MGVTMSGPKAVPSTITGPLKEAVLKLCEKDGLCVRMSIYSKDLKELWTDVCPGDGMAQGANIAAAKAKSFLEGDEMVDGPTAGIMAGFMCMCNGKMPVKGVVALEIAGTEAACFVCNGAPAGPQDLQVAE